MKNKNIAALLAFFLGGLGVHMFYLGKTQKAIIYLLFSWTLIPAIIGIIDSLILASMSKLNFDLKYNGLYLYQQKETERLKQENFRKRLVTMLNRGEYEAIYNECKDFQTEDPSILQVLGTSYFKLGKSEVGEKLFRKSLAKGGGNEALLNLGRSLYAIGDYRKAIKYLQEISPVEIEFMIKEYEDYSVLYMLAKCFCKLEKPEAALEVLKKAPLNKKVVSSELNDLIILVAECYESAGNKKMAIKFYNKALSNDFSLSEIEKKINELEETA